MSNRTSPRRGGKGRRITVRGDRRAEPDLKRLSRALLNQALAEAAAEAAAEEQAAASPKRTRPAAGGGAGAA